MKIQICSDLHLEFPNNRNWLMAHPLTQKGDVLIVAGDTYYLERNYGKLDFIKHASNNFEAVYLIPGNHEYYGGFDISTALKPTFREIKHNVFLLNNHSIELNNIRFIFTTMWSKIERNIFAVMQGMMDFQKIKFGEEKFSVDHYNHIYEAAFKFLSTEVCKPGKKVVVSHHLPSQQCNAKEFKGSVLNEAFCVEHSKLMLDYDIDFWIYGHSHRNLTDFSIGNTKLVTNQLGYVDWNEHHTFDYGKVIELPE